MLLYIQQQHADADLISPACLNGFAVSLAFGLARQQPVAM